MKMRPQRVWILIAGIALAGLALSVSVWGSAGTGPAIEAVGFLVFALSPFLALAVVARRLPRWLSLTAAVGFAAMLLETVREVSNSTSSTAVIAFVFVPIILLMVVPLLLAATQAVQLVRARRAGGIIVRPGRRDLALGLILGVIGFFTLFIFGLLAGLALTFAIWATRSVRVAGAAPQS